MDLSLLTIAKRADLSNRIERTFSNATERISHIQNITEKINTSIEFTPEEKLQSRESGIIGLMSICEQTLNEILHLVLVSFPKKFGNKQFEVEELMEEGSILELFNKKANQKLLDMAYGRFDKFMTNFKNTLDLNRDFEQNAIEVINEIKCTRDCLIHSGGKASDLYFSKTKSQARVRVMNERLDVNFQYFLDSIGSINNLISNIKSALPNNLTESKKAYIFRQMWEATCLNDRIKFNVAWNIEGQMVRPVDIENNYGFSSSEIEVYNLFRHIYNDKYKVDYAQYFYKWKPHTNEYHIATSWLDSQFYF